MGTLKIKVDGQYVTIPRGPKGDTGATNVISIGTVTTGAAGSSAAASMTGTAPAQTLNLTIPRGDTGAQGPAGSLASVASGTSEMKVWIEERTMPAVGSTVNLGTLRSSDTGAGALRLAISVEGSGYSAVKIYEMAFRYAMDVSWGVVYPVHDTGIYMDKDFQLEASTNVTNQDRIELRVRSLTGTVSAGTKISAAFLASTTGAVTWTSSTTVATPSAVTRAFSARMDAVLGRVSEISSGPTVGATTTVDLSKGMNHIVTLTANTTLAITNVDQAPNRVSTVNLVIKQDATGGRTIGWPTGTKWPNGVAPVLTTTANATNVVTLMTTDAGTTWLGFLAGAGMA